MGFAQRDDVIKNLAPGTADAALRDPVLPGCSDARALGFQTCVIQENDHVAIEFRVMVEDSVAVRPGFRKCLAQLLENPIGSRMRGHIKVQDSAAPVLDDEQTVHQAKGGRWHGEEVEGDNRLAMILEERQPIPFGIAASPKSAEITSDGSF